MVLKIRKFNKINATHIKELAGSGITVKFAKENRVRSIEGDEAKKLLNRKTEVGPGLLYSYQSGDGLLEGVYNFKPDTPLHSKEEGREGSKYVMPIGQKCHLYIPRSVWPVIPDSRIPLFITEGEKKCLKATQEGFPTIGISGVWNWLSDGEPIKDFDLIALKGRTIYLVFDSDKFTKEAVLLAERRLAEFLISRGGYIKIINLPEDKQ